MILQSIFSREIGLNNNLQKKLKRAEREKTNYCCNKHNRYDFCFGYSPFIQSGTCRFCFKYEPKTEREIFTIALKRER